MTTMRSHRAALALYAGMYDGHTWATGSIGRLLDLAARTITGARHCFKCGGRGVQKGSFYPCPNCAGFGFVVESRAPEMARTGGGVSW